MWENKTLILNCALHGGVLLVHAALPVTWACIGENISHSVVCTMYGVQAMI